MKRKKFRLWHSVVGTAALLFLEAALLAVLSPMTALDSGLILVFAVVGAAANLYIATEAIEEIRGTMYLLMLLSVIVLEFVVFFAFQYWFLLLLQPASFPTLSLDPSTLLLHSTMVFVLNPIYLPDTTAGKLLLLVNTLSSLGIVMFILQNIWQFRRTSSN